MNSQTPQTPPLTPDAVHDVKFTPVRFRREGYAQDEVDNFLDRVENQLRDNEEYAQELIELLQHNGITVPVRLDPAPGDEALLQAAA